MDTLLTLQIDTLLTLQMDTLKWKLMEISNKVYNPILWIIHTKQANKQTQPKQPKQRHQNMGFTTNTKFVLLKLRQRNFWSIHIQISTNLKKFVFNQFHTFHPPPICTLHRCRKTCAWLDEQFRTFHPSLHESVTVFDTNSSLPKAKTHLKSMKNYGKKFKILSYQQITRDDYNANIWKSNSIQMMIYLWAETVFQRCPVKKVLLEISQKSQENTCAESLFK